MRKRDRKIIHRAIDGEVTPSETRILRRRIKTDPETRAEYHQLRKVVHTSKKVRVKVSSGFTRKVMKGVKAARRKR